MLVLVVPSYYIYIIIESAKNNYRENYRPKIDELEERIDGDTATDIDILKYNTLIYRENSLETIRAWPANFENIIEIVMAAVLGILPTIVTIYYNMNK